VVGLFISQFCTGANLSGDDDQYKEDDCTKWNDEDDDHAGCKGGSGWAGVMVFAWVVSGVIPTLWTVCVHPEI
jgi:hypothetical protein